MVIKEMDALHAKRSASDCYRVVGERSVSVRSHPRWCRFTLCVLTCAQVDGGQRAQLARACITVVVAGYPVAHTRHSPKRVQKGRLEAAIVFGVCLAQLPRLRQRSAQRMLAFGQL
jgi:hypothetical protein